LLGQRLGVQPTLKNGFDAFIGMTPNDYSPVTGLLQSFRGKLLCQPENAQTASVVGADMICQGFASAASLPGTYKAWLSDSSGTVYPANSFTHSIHPYVLVDGTTVAYNWTDLTDGSIEVPINMIAAGIINPNIKVWTNVTTAGECFTTVDAPMHTCNNWTSNSHLDYGFTGTTWQPNAPPPGWENHWTEHNVHPCNDRDVRLYCFQQ